MIWCLISMAIVAALLGLAALMMRVPHPDLAQVRPGRALRGCVALLFLLAAVGLGGLALLLAQR